MRFLLEKDKSGNITKIDIKTSDINETILAKSFLDDILGNKKYNIEKSSLIDKAPIESTAKEKEKRVAIPIDEDYEDILVDNIKAKLPNTFEKLRCDSCNQAIIFKVESESDIFKPYYVFSSKGRLYKIPDEVDFSNITFDKDNKNNQDIYSDLVEYINNENLEDIFLIDDEDIRISCPICGKKEKLDVFVNHFLNNPLNCHVCGESIDLSIKDKENECVNKCMKF